MPRTTIHSDLEATVSFETEKQDYGVPGSPVWDEIDPSSMELESLWMFGKEWTEAELRLTFGDMGADAIAGLIFDMVEDWEDD